MNDPIDIAHFQECLLRLQTEIRSLQTERDASTATVVLDQSSVGRLSRMDALQQQAMAQDGRRRAEEMLRRIAAALRRCEDGRYGTCLSCDEPIDPRRLELDPTATLCIACAQARDT
ncbi:MAG: TraR/DksA family transcriptional regulator [Gammaproteobacteria bacterium]